MKRHWRQSDSLDRCEQVERSKIFITWTIFAQRRRNISSILLNKMARNWKAYDFDLMKDILLFILKDEKWHDPFHPS